MDELTKEEQLKKEKVIKSWNFLNEITNGKRRSKQTLKNSLIITDKRLILESNLVDSNSVGTNREEIAIDAIKGVQTGYSTKQPFSPNKAVAIIMIVLSLILFMATFVGDSSAGLKVFTIFVVIAFTATSIALLLIKTKANMIFKLVILSNIFPANAINISTIVNAPAQATANNITKVSPSLKLVFFDPKIAKEIVATIGELLLVEQN